MIAARGLPTLRNEMRKCFFFGLLLAALVSAYPPSLRSQMSEEEKKRLFLKAREDIRPRPRPAASATPRPKPRAASTPVPTPRETPEPTPKPTPGPSPRATVTPAKPVDDEDIIPLPGKPSEPRETPEPKPTPAPRATPQPAPSRAPKTPGDRMDAPILIEKSGLEADEGYQPPQKSSGGWFKRWRHLSPSVRRAIDQAPVKKGRWKYIVVHNSGTRQGNARIFDTYHRRVRKMQNGMAYHFVIGNGSSSGDGQIEVGSRWTRQVNGGHVASDYLNNIALGICLVGDFNRDSPTKAQLAALEELITYLRGRVGRVKGKPSIVMPHTDINPKPTDCPGDKFAPWVRQKYGSSRR